MIISGIFSFKVLQYPDESNMLKDEKRILGNQPTRLLKDYLWFHICPPWQLLALLFLIRASFLIFSAKSKVKNRKEHSQFPNMIIIEESVFLCMLLLKNSPV